MTYTSGSHPLDDRAFRSTSRDVSKFARARRLDDSVVEEIAELAQPDKPVHRHPNESFSTQRIPFPQLRDLVVSMLEDDDDWASEWESEIKPTTYVPRKRRPPPPPPKRAAQRLGTLDELIASLRTGR